MTNTLPELVDMQTAKRRFGFKTGTLTKLVLEREIDSFLIDDRIKISVDSLQEYLKRQRVEPDGSRGIANGEML